MTYLFSGPLTVAYAQAYLLPPRAERMSPEDAFRDQTNGLLGARVSGGLFLVTGLHTGRVNLAVELLEHAPSAAGDWEEVVEASVRVQEQGIELVEWADDKYPLALPSGVYRVRYSSRNFGVAERDYIEDAVEIEFYRLEFWPEDGIRSDHIVRTSSDRAAYWHSVAQTIHNQTDKARGLAAQHDDEV